MMRAMMEIVSLYWILGASAVMIFIAFVYWATKPDRCPECGEIMKHRRTFANGKTVDYMVCPKCGTTFIDV